MRCCVPLDRVTIKGIHDYHSFATLVGLDIELDDKQRITWRPGNIAEDDFSGANDEPANTDQGKQILNKAVATGLSAMSKRSFSLKEGFKNKSRETSPGPKVDRSPSFNIPFKSKESQTRELSDDRGSSTESPALQPIRRRSTVWIDSTIPPRLAAAGRESSDNDLSSAYDSEAYWRDAFDFNVAVLNEQAWFAEALQAAVGAAGERKYRPDVVRPKMRLDVAGFDCLATDEDIEESQSGMRRRDSEASTESHIGAPDGVSNGLRKREKASMAAKMFGLNEEEGIWRKYDS